MQARRIAIVFFIAFSFDYLYVCRRTTKSRIDMDISSFPHIPVSRYTVVRVSELPVLVYAPL